MADRAGGSQRVFYIREADAAAPRVSYTFVWATVLGRPQFINQNQYQIQRQNKPQHP